MLHVLKYPVTSRSSSVFIHTCIHTHTHHHQPSLFSSPSDGSLPDTRTGGAVRPHPVLPLWQTADCPRPLLSPSWAQGHSECSPDSSAAGPGRATKRPQQSEGLPKGTSPPGLRPSLRSRGWKACGRTPALTGQRRKPLGQGQVPTRGDAALGDI